MSTFLEATDSMNEMMRAAWSTTGYQLHWDAVRTARDATEQPWAVFVTRHATGRQDTLGGVGNRSFQRIGTLIASIFVPIGKGLSESYGLAKVVADAYEGQTSEAGVWFRNVRIQEIGREGQFYQTNVLIDFEYYETK